MFLALGAGLIAAALTVQYRDIQHILPVLIPFMLYASPVAYDVSQIPERYQRLFYLINPLAALIVAFRSSLLPTSPMPPLSVSRRGRQPLRPDCSCSAPRSSGGPSGDSPMSSSEPGDLGPRRRQEIHDPPRLHGADDARRGDCQAGAASVRARGARGVLGAERRVLRRAPRRGAGADRQQRRGQEHAAEDSLAHHGDVRGAGRSLRPRRKPSGSRHGLQSGAHRARKHLPQRRDSRHDPRGDSPAVRCDRRVRRRRALSRHAGEALQQRHVRAARLCRGGAPAQRNSDR